MLDAALTGGLDNVETTKDEFFNLEIPASCANVPTEVLNPKNTWADKNAYDETAKKLANMFNNNFKEYETESSEEISKAGPNKYE